MNIILASQSPRRRELLERVGLKEFQVASPDVDERVGPGLSPARMVEELSLRKARAAAKKAGPSDLIIAADTVVALDGAVLGKPWDKGAASAADATDGTDKTIMRSEQEVNRAVEQYSDMVQRLCMIHLKNRADTEDIFQTVFLKYVLSSVSFESREHEKAWFIRVTINACKDLLKKFFRSHTVSLDEIMEQPAELPPDNRHVLEAVLSLPAKYKEVVYLHYYEDYTAPQISHILGKNVNTIYTLLTRSRQMLKEKLGGDEL